MIDILLALFPIFLLIVTAEVLWKTKKISVETSRKIIHIGTGVLIAYWPYFLDWSTIQLLSLAMLAVILISYRLHILQSIHAVKRITRGEILYPVGVGVAALLEPAPWIFSAAILHLAVADAVAALAGIKWGKRTHYMLISHGKSLVGSLAFFAVSFLIFLSLSFIVDDNVVPLSYSYFVGFSLVLTLIENISWFGADNITVPVAVILLLSSYPA